MSAADEPIRRRMMGLSDDELRRAVTVEADDWQPEALAVAREELARRGIRDVETAAPLAAPETDKRRPLYRNGVPLVLLAIILIRVLIFLLAH